MRTLVIYDISDNRKRKQVSEACLDYGLERIQLSAFEGELTATERKELASRCRAILGMGKDKGEVQFIPVCEKDLVQRSSVTIGERRSKVGRVAHGYPRYPGTNLRRPRNRPMTMQLLEPWALKGRAEKRQSSKYGFRFF